MRGRLIVITGPTAVGKTDYSISLALEHGSPVISCDSRQIYKEMSIGTAVPDASQLAAVKHYFIHSHSVTQNYTAGDYELEAIPLIEKLFTEYRKVVPFVDVDTYMHPLIMKSIDFLRDEKNIVL